jgi:antitoxin VapB
MIALSKETEALARRLAAAQSLPVDDAVRRALENWARVAGVSAESCRRDQSPAAIAARKASVDRIVAEIAAMPILNPRDPREIMDDLNSP